MKRTLSALAFVSTSGFIFAQNVGISEATPNSKLDVVQTEATGNALEVSHNIVGNASSGFWLKNNANAGGAFGTLGMNVQNLVPANVGATAQFIQNGLGNGTSTYINNAGSLNPTAYLQNSGGGNGITNWSFGNGQGIYNDVANNLGLYNVVRSNSFGSVHLLTFAGGIGDYIDLDVNNGTGTLVYAIDDPNAPAAGGDVFAFTAMVHTATPTAAGAIWGAAFRGEQYGPGHGIIVNHTGTQGRNAEFNLNNPANPDPVLFMTSQGTGSVIQAQNQSNAITGTMIVGDFVYTGTDADDHIGVSGISTPASGMGIGLRGTGNWYGVFSNGDMGATGVKTFLIDHPEDPANKMLRHFSVESNEVLNMYRGMVTLDNNGQAIVELPQYFDDINKNYSYQLTPVGTPEQPYVLSEIQGNTFEVAGAPGTKVSWVVYADRDDAYMQEHPELATDVVEKTGGRQGKYLQPELHGQPSSMGMAQPATKAVVNNNLAPALSTEKMNEVRSRVREPKPQFEEPGYDIDEE